ncbi:MAG: rhomboid family intramembrane serine protease [Actinobacteria bacterium]|nr:rhomboid family intramembrane serine protease [Actinomycetota bacterium]
MLPLFDKNPTRKTPYVTLVLIAINAAVFIYMLFLSTYQYDLFIYRFSVVPWEIVRAGQLPLPVLQQLFAYPLASIPSKPVYLSLLTSLFLHDGWLHIIGNMLFLWIFGNNVEDVMGHLGFLVFYLACGAFGTFAHVAMYTNSLNPLLGASGAISGVLGAYLLLYPRAWVWTWVLIVIIPIPAYVVIGFWIVLQVFEGVTSVGTGMVGTAFFAHLGGVAIGMIIAGILYPVLRRRRDALARMPALQWWERSSSPGPGSGPF